MASRDWSGRPPGGTESNISEKLFNALNNESYSNQLMAGATGQNQNQLMARATGYLKAMQMNDISDMLYHNESHVIDQMIDQATEILSEMQNRSTVLRQLVGKKFLLQLKLRLM